nr:unnamed protein product [Callosobruchus analis]
MLILLPSSADRENYGDADVGYVQLKREGHVCLVKAKICPEHKVRNKDNLVTLVVDEQSETVTDVTCNDCPASSGMQTCHCGSHVGTQKERRTCSNRSRMLLEETNLIEDRDRAKIHNS